MTALLDTQKVARSSDAPLTWREAMTYVGLSSRTAFFRWKKKLAVRSKRDRYFKADLNQGLQKERRASA